MKQPGRIVFLRHGEPSGNNSSAGKIFRGVTDDELTPLGWQQMFAAVNNMSLPETVFSSPLKRCADFARRFCNEKSLPLQISDALKEIDFGLWEGQSVAAIARDNAQLLEKFWQDPIVNTPPAGEPVADFQQRVVAFWNELLSSQQGKTCLLIAHGGVQKMILSEVLKIPLSAMHNIELSYACCSIFTVYYDEAETFVTLNSHSHLEDALIYE